MDEQDYTPLDEPVWTLAMALAWFMWRDIGKVADVRNKSVGQLMAYAYASEDNPLVPFRRSLELIRRRAMETDPQLKLSIRMISPDMEARELSRDEWKYLELSHGPDLADRFWFRPPSGAPHETGFVAANIDRDDVMKSWRPQGGLSLTPIGPDELAIVSGLTAALATPKRRRKREAQDQVRVKPFLAELYPEGVPDKYALTDGQLVKEVADAMKKNAPSRETILRAAGRL